MNLQNIKIPKSGTIEASEANTASEGNLTDITVVESASPVNALVNRPIVFRAWNKNWKEMEHEVYDVTPSEDYILMQSTGFIDATGNEIYEGDFIRQWLDDSVEEDGGFYWYAVIRFMKGCWVACQTDYCYSETSFDNFTNLYEDSRNFEVIGNIFKTPEIWQKGG